ncbi:aldehyde ferredoxin oxidoreductase family protein [Candidatus Bathyarchaeota archaeon]|nr:aldehyde ferredoxin oxidoreductase family protein [Candidatus Bathyarchaeota archaeon]
MYGCWGRILEVDLSKKKETVRSVEEGLLRKLLGGVGIAAKIILEEVPADADPLGPENVLVVGTGPFQGTAIPGSGKWIVAAKSPLTGIWGDSCGGGDFAPDLKGTGFDAIVVKGKADSPVYIWVNEGEVQIRDASSIWGKSTSETIEAVKSDLGDKAVKVVCIGPAGEKLVRFACISSGFGFAGRTGLGAVMGSKNLKAIAVRGTKRVDVAEPDKLAERSRELSRRLYENSLEGMRKYGTMLGMQAGQHDDRGYGLKHNWDGGVFEEISKINEERVREITVGEVPCSNCPVACHRHTRVTEPEKYAYDGHGPEYETVAMLGWLTMIADIKAVGYMGHLCNEYGIDTISTGSMIAFTMECYEKGWIDETRLGGVKPVWGDADSAIELIHMIASRRDFGEVLANGIRSAAEFIGRGAKEIIVECKGLDYPAHDPRSYYPTAINYATGVRGACHQRGVTAWVPGGFNIPEWGVLVPNREDRYTMKNAAHIAAKCQDWASFSNSLVQCEFMFWSGLTFRDQVELLNLVTGWGLDAEAVAEISERITTLQRLINVRFGVRRKDDYLSPKMFKPQPSGASAGKVPQPFEEALLEYYRLRGWDENGIPTKEKLESLGLTQEAGYLPNP